MPYQTPVQWQRSRLHTFGLAVRILVGRLSLPAPPPFSPYRGSNRRPKNSTVGCITIRPLLALRTIVLPTVWS